MSRKKVARSENTLSERESAPRRGRVIDVADSGGITVCFRASEPEGSVCDVLESSPMAPAVFTVGDEVLVLDDASSSVRPIVLGRVRSTQSSASGRIELAASRELVLRCGAGAIVMRADGRIAITGLDIVTSAQRRQRIKGASVEIN